MSSELTAEAWAALIGAGFLDAYLNINGVSSEAEAERMLRNDIGLLATQGFDLATLDAARAGEGLREALKQAKDRPSSLHEDNCNAIGGLHLYGDDCCDCKGSRHLRAALKGPER